MKKQLTRLEFESVLQGRYVNKQVSFAYPGYDIIYGKCDRISVESVHDPEVIIMINGNRYTCSPESLKQCLNLLT